MNSFVSCSTCPKGPLDEIGIICSFVCVCDIKPLKGKGGRNLKQLCVTTGLEWMQASGQGENILPEVGYFMGQKGSNVKPKPLMKKPTIADNDIPEPIRNHWHKFNRVKGMLKEEGETYTRGMLRIPDVVITREVGMVPEQQNIKKVVEINFPGDKWGDGQKEDYEKIAGGEKDLIEMTPAYCGCDQDSEKNKKAKSSPQPELENAWDQERDRQDNSALIDSAIMVGGTIAIAVLILDDLLPFGVTQVDDALIPITGAAMARSAARLATAFSGAVAVPALP